MTRETKVGVVVGTTFLCLVSLVVASKLRGPETISAAVADVTPTAGGGPGPAKADGVEPCEPGPDKLPTVPPNLQIPKKSRVDPVSKPMPQLPAPLQPVGAGIAAPAIALPEVTALPTVAEASSSGWWDRHGRTVESAVSPDPVQPMPAQELPAAVKVAQLEEPKKLLEVKPGLPPVDPPTAPMPVGGLPGADPVQPVPSPRPPMPDPIQLPTVTGDASQEVKPPTPIVLPTAPAVQPPAPIEPKQMPPAADPVLPPAPGVAPGAAPAPAAPKPASIGTIGTIGNEATVTPALKAPAIGAALPKVFSHSDDVHRVDAGQTTFAQLSQRWYGTDKYGQALLEYNRRHLLNRASPDLKRDPPLLQPNQPIYYPHPNVLESAYAAFVGKTTPAVAPTVGSGPPVQISPPMPLSPAAAAAEGTVPYTVPQTEHIMPIAQRTLGNRDAWAEISLLNPALRTDLPIPAGTVLRLPARARTN
jgi:hypothetical protein